MLQNLIGNMPNPVFVYDHHWMIFSMNKAALELLGYSGTGELTGQSIHDIFSESNHPEINEIIRVVGDIGAYRSVKELHHIGQDGKPVNVIARFGVVKNSAPGGKQMYIESAFPSGGLFNWHNDQINVLENYKTLAENVPGLDMILVNSDLEILCRVGSEIRIQGLADADTVPVNLMEYFTEDIINILRPLLKIAFESTPVSREFRAGNRYFSVRMIPLIEDTAEISCVIVLQNITETKLIEEKLKESKREADQANEAKGNFIAKMSHEIRTPLNAIIGFSERLKKTRLTKKQEHYLGVVHSSSQHLLSIIDEILVLSKIESGDIHVEEVPFRPGTVLKAVQNVVELKYKEKNLVYRTIFDPALDEVLLGDPARLRQVLINLVNNAIKFTAKGSVVLKCSLERATQISVFLKFEVSDTGIGIAPEDIENIFKPFHQVDDSIGRKYSGTGLGLTISKDIIEKQGGRLKVESTPGEGTVFSFVLEFIKSKIPVLDKSEQHPEVPKALLKNIRVLFVDDDPVNRMLGKAILSELKIKTDYASSGTEALRFYKPGRYDIILLDINMPGIDGVEVAKQIRRQEFEGGADKKTRIVAMTANVFKQHIQRYFDTGMDDIMLKPFREETLIEKIAKSRSGSRVSAPKPPRKPVPADPGKEEHIDLEQLNRITKGDREFTLTMLNAFVENSENLLEEMDAALTTSDYPRIAEAAHRLLPSVQQLGMKIAASRLLRIDQRYLRKKKFTPDEKLIKTAISKVKICIELVKSERTRIIKQL